LRVTPADEKSRHVAGACLVAAIAMACGSTLPAPLPTGLPDDHVLFAADYIVHDPVVEGVYDPRLMTLTADGRLVLERRDVDSIMGATATRLDAARLRHAWSAITGSGVLADGVLRLPGFANQTVTTATNVFSVDDGTRSTRLTIDDLGSEAVFPGDPPIPPSEKALRAAATLLMDQLRAFGDMTPWTPPALLLYWRGEVPHDADATVVPWSGPIDLAKAGTRLEHPVWERCLRVDGPDAAAISGIARAIPIEHLVEQDGTRYAIDVRPIHADELDKVDCP
jgi:hypothetical protein